MKESVYTIVDYPKFNMEYGTYKSKSPLSAAKKAFTQLQKSMKLSNSLEQKQYIEFTLRNKQTNQFYTYLGTKIQLNSSLTITQNGKQRNINHKHLLCRKPIILNTEVIKTLVNNYNNSYNKINKNSYNKIK